MIKAAIFDMDGLLIDSEHFWQQTEREIFRNLGIPVTEEMQKQTFGLRTDEQVKFWYDYKPWTEPGIQSIIKEYDKRVLNFFIGDAELMKGARYILEFFRNRKFTMAIASSSSTILINTFLDRFNLRNYFDIIYSAEHEEYGKPHPAVYLSTVKMMNIEPWNCLVFEDSLNGIISARAARMKTVAVPDKKNFAEKGYAIADLKIPSLKDFGANELKKLLI